VLRLWNTSVEIDVERDAHGEDLGGGDCLPRNEPPPLSPQASAYPASSTSATAASRPPTRRSFSGTRSPGTACACCRCTRPASQASARSTAASSAGAPTRPSPCGMP
jgi:hypothetical protein